VSLLPCCFVDIVIGDGVATFSPIVAAVVVASVVAAAAFLLLSAVRGAVLPGLAALLRLLAVVVIRHTGLSV
jgi:hypothetical protein